MTLIDIDKINLPTLPATAKECISQIYNGEVDIAYIAQLAQKDPGLASSILKIANSAAYSSGKATSDLIVAMTRLGLSTVTQLFVTKSLENFLKIEPPIGFFSLKGFVKHCAWVSQIAFELGKILNLTEKNDLLIAGLIHDIGLLAQYYASKENFAKLVNECTNKKIDFVTAEKLLKLDSHEQLGEEITRKWQLPENVITIVKYHHTPDTQRPQTISANQNKSINLLILADLAAHRFGNSYKDYPRETNINRIDLHKTGLSNKELTLAVKTASINLSNY